MPANSKLRSTARLANLGVVAAFVAGVAVLVGVMILASRGSRAAAESPASPASQANPLRTEPDAKPDQAANVAPTKSDGGVRVAAAAKEADAAKPAEPVAAVPPGQHPLDPAIDLASKVLDNLHKNVKDYTAVMIKQERIDGKLNDPEYMQAKIRQEPLSVYFKFLKPPAIVGREVIYVAGANDGKLLAREGSGLKRRLGIIPLDPNSALAMDGQRYPITSVGLTFLTKRLLEVATQDRKYGEAEVHFYKNSKVNKRNCTLIEVVHPEPRTYFLFYKARIYIDDELNVPIRYEAYLWPKKPGDDPPLDEAYTYLNLKLNVGLTDADFDTKNPNYNFIDK